MFRMETSFRHYLSQVTWSILNGLFCVWFFFLFRDFFRSVFFFFRFVKFSNGFFSLFFRHSFENRLCDSKDTHKTFFYWNKNRGLSQTHSFLSPFLSDLSGVQSAISIPKKFEKYPSNDLIGLYRWCVKIQLRYWNNKWSQYGAAERRMPEGRINKVNRHTMSANERTTEPNLFRSIIHSVHLQLSLEYHFWRRFVCMRRFATDFIYQSLLRLQLAHVFAPIWRLLYGLRFLFAAFAFFYRVFFLFKH